VDHSNNYVERLNVDDKVANGFNILANSVWMSYIIILLVQTVLFSDLYLAKFLDASKNHSFRVYLDYVYDKVFLQFF